MPAKSSIAITNSLFRFIKISLIPYPRLIREISGLFEAVRIRRAPLFCFMLILLFVSRSNIPQPKFRHCQKRRAAGYGVSACGTGGSSRAGSKSGGAGSE
jgi:hypothetical protein